MTSPADFRLAARTLARSPGFTAAAILALALGIGASTTVFAVVEAVLLRPLPVPAAARLALVWNRSASAAEGWLSRPELEDLRRASTTFRGFAGLRDERFALTGGAEPEEVEAAAASAELFPLAGVAPALGRSFLPAEDRRGAPRVALLSYDLWRRRFGGDPRILGRAVILDGVGHTVVGVLPAGFRILPPSSVFPRRVDLWVPLEPALSTELLRRRDVHHLHVLGRLRPGISPAAAQADLDGISRRLRREHPELYGEPGWHLAAVPLREQVVRGARPVLLLLSAAVAVLLSIACANVANLLLARNASRGREMAIRAALGAGRGRLAAQLLAESLLLGLAGALGGMLLADAALGLLRRAGPAGLPRLEEAALDPGVLAFALAGGLLTTLLFGLAPALSAAGADAIATGAGRGATGGPAIRRGRRLLAATQIALALVLLSATGLLVESLLRLGEAPLGFAPGSALAMRLALSPDRHPAPRDRAAFVDELTVRVAALPGVAAAGAVTQLPLSGAYLASGFAAADRPDRELAADLRGATPGYFAALGIPLLRGRTFGAADRAGAPPVALIDATLARRLWPGRDPVGQRLLWVRGGPPIEVIGVVGAVEHYGPGMPPRETVYRPYAQYANASAIYLVARGTGAVPAAVREEIHRLDPEQPVADVRGMDERVGEALGEPRLRALLLGAFAAIALGLAWIGIHGVIAFGVARRRREIAIRMALGARRADVLAMVVGEGLSTALAGVAAGAALSQPAERALGRFLYGVAPGDPAIFAAGALLLAAAALVAGYLPARRAAAVDPASALEVE